MRTTLTAVEVTTSERLDVLVDVEPGDQVSALETALAGLLPTASPGLWLGDRALDPSDTIRAAGVRAGGVLSLGGPLPDLPSLTSTRAQLHVVSGPGAGAIHPLPDGDTVVGSGATISLTDAGNTSVAHRNLLLHCGPAGVVATDLGGASSVRCAGQPLQGPTPIGAADLLEVGGHLLAVVPVSPPDAALTPGDDLAWELNRPPRLRPAHVVSTVKLPSPPTESEPHRLVVLPLMLPMLLAVILAAVSSPLFLLLGLISPLLALGILWSDRSPGSWLGVRAAAKHARAVAAAEAKIARLTAAETLARRDACPDAAVLQRAAVGPGRRVWERRRTDDDSLLLRVGTGTAAPESLRVTAAASEVRPPQPLLRDVPVTVAMREVGVLGVAGPSTTGRALARWLIGQAAVLHSPSDLSVLLLVDPAAPPSEPDWGWLRWLPHAAPASGQDCTALVGATFDSLTARVAELTALIVERVAEAQDVRAQQTGHRQPDVLMVLDGARRLRALPGMAAILRDGPAVGVHVVCLDENDKLLPEECQAVVTLDGPGQLTLRRTGDQPRTGVRADLVDATWAERVARGLAPLRAAVTNDSEGQLPVSVRLLDVLALDPPTSAAVLKRWGCTTAAVVGRVANGEFVVDLKRDGPHTLVAGATGAGKSEFLQTLVASLAAANRPDAMTFVLVDYRGGATFRDCARLPHTVGLVTDLDDHLVERALVSLTAELTTRQHLLELAGAKDIDDYWQAGATQGALPRLVIVIDEFDRLIEELPDFVRGLFAIADRGRSLGVHLVLSTQRPSGVVSPQIRTATNLRMALRVTDPTDSLDVIGAPDAAAIAENRPGRGYARTNRVTLSAFQTARVSGRTPGAVVTSAAPVEATELPWLRVGESLSTLPTVRTETEPDQDQTDLHALVEAIREAAAELALPPAHSPWLAPLPGTITLDEIRRLVPIPRVVGLPPVVFGLEDLPAEQARRAAVLDLEHGGHLLVAGEPGAGRSTLLRSLAASLASTVVPADAHLYALDCGTDALLALAELPHCGAVVSTSQVERADRLLTRLATEVARRRELLDERGFADLAEQRVSTADPLPYLVLLVDGWEGFTGAFEEVDAGRMIDTFLGLLRKGPQVGLRVVVTGDRSVFLSDVFTAIEDRLVLRMGDRRDYSFAGLAHATLPDDVATGRGFRADSGSEVQVALLTADASGPAQDAIVSELAATLPPAKGRKPFLVDVQPPRR